MGSYDRGGNRRAVGEETVMISMTPEDLENSRLQRTGSGFQVNDGEFDPAARLKAGTHAHTWTHCEIHPTSRYYAFHRVPQIPRTPCQPKCNCCHSLL